MNSLIQKTTASMTKEEVIDLLMLEAEECKKLADENKKLKEESEGTYEDFLITEILGCEHEDRVDAVEKLKKETEKLKKSLPLRLAFEKLKEENERWEADDINLTKIMSMINALDEDFSVNGVDDIYECVKELVDDKTLVTTRIRGLIEAGEKSVKWNEERYNDLKTLAEDKHEICQKFKKENENLKKEITKFTGDVYLNRAITEVAKLKKEVSRHRLVAGNLDEENKKLKDQWEELNILFEKFSE
jgi:hypothetical protein|tara:strand:+ start:1547 stop:2284 length:738 start_codon:yes stop_codon:yes gene_type:complete